MVYVIVVKIIVIAIAKTVSLKALQQYVIVINISVLFKSPVSLSQNPSKGKGAIRPDGIPFHQKLEYPMILRLP